MSLSNKIVELTLLLSKWDTIWTANEQPHSLSICCWIRWGCLAERNAAILTSCQSEISWGMKCDKTICQSMTNSLLAMKWDLMDFFWHEVQFHSPPVDHEIIYMKNKYSVTHKLVGIWREVTGKNGMLLTGCWEWNCLWDSKLHETYFNLSWPWHSEVVGKEIKWQCHSQPVVMGWDMAVIDETAWQRNKVEVSLTPCGHGMRHGSNWWDGLPARHKVAVSLTSCGHGMRHSSDWWDSLAKK